MLRIVNKEITTAWTDVSLKRVYLSGSFICVSRSGNAFEVRKKGDTNTINILASESFCSDISSVGGVVFQARAAGTETLEIIVSGDCYTTPIGDPPSGEWVIGENGEYLVDSNDDFLYA